MLDKRKEAVGELFILAQAVLYGLFPVVINYSVKLMPPILFAGLSSFLAAICFFVFVSFQGKIKELINKKALPYMLAVTLFIIILPSIFIFLGTKITSGVNTTILLQTEVLFTFIFVGLFFNERITLMKIIGAATIVLGTVFILYNGTFALNLGDIFIIIGVMFFPFGNMAAKKALAIVPPSVILFVRSFLGGLSLIIISLFLEQSASQIVPSLRDHVFFILVDGIIIMFISKALWYEGLKRVDITKAIPIGMSFPAFSLLFLYFFVQEVPTVYQWIGLAFSVVGVGFLTYKSAPTIIQWFEGLFKKKEETPPFT